MIERRRLAASFCCAILLASSTIGAAQSARSSAAAADLDQWVARAMKTFEVPGVALAIVKDDAVVVAKGYGVRKLGEPAAVDAKTLFGIASNTKAFTATALGLLVEEKRIEWDAPVIRYLPAFAMWDPYVTRELTVRDLLVHRSGLGLGAGDLLWWPASTYDRKEIARRLRFIQPVTSFRTAYAYDNVLYLVAGEVIEAVSGQSWEDFVASRILAKVGMTGSNVRHSAAASRDGNVAATHAPIDGKVKPIAPFDSDNTNPAGGINSSAEDMAKWLRVQLAGGRLSDGSRLFSAATARELTTIVTPIPTSDPPPELAPLKSNFRGYALGFDIRDYRGHKLVTHTGGLPGYVSRVAMVPDVNVGVAVLTNQESTQAFDAITFRILDHYLDAAPFDWIEGFAKVSARTKAAELQRASRDAASANSSSRPSLPLARYAGTYRDAWYGDIAISESGGKLAMQFSHTPLLVGDLQHWQHDTFIVRWRDRELRADAYVTFALNPDGSIESGEDEGRVAGHRLQLRLSRPPAQAGESLTPLRNHGGHGGHTEDMALLKKVPCAPFVSVSLVVALFVLLPAAAIHAQGVGFTGGAAIDPAQAYVGSYLESARIANHIRVRAGIDGAFGGDVSEALIDFVFQYEIPFAPFSPWYVYQGTGPTVAIARADGNRHASGGFLAIFGIGHTSGFFVEAKVSGGGGPNLRVGVGYTIRRKQP